MRASVAPKDLVFRESERAVIGESPTVADALLGALLWHLEQAARMKLDLSSYPKLQRYWSAMQDTAAYRETFDPSTAAIAKLREVKGLEP